MIRIFPGSAKTGVPQSEIRTKDSPALSLSISIVVCSSSLCSFNSSSSFLILCFFRSKAPSDASSQIIVSTELIVFKALKEISSSFPIGVDTT